MEALMKTERAPGARLVNVDVPRIGTKDVLIRVKAAAICGSDIHIYEWSPFAQARIKPPIIFGHEGCGEVVEVGSQVTNVTVGDLIAIETHISDNECYQCQTGARHICEKLTVIGVDTDGVFAQYAKLPAACCWKLPEGTNPDLGAIMEPIGVAVNGALKEGISNRSVAVFGCGPIGLFCLGALNFWGATKIFAIDPKPNRLAMAGTLAPDAVQLNPEKEDVVSSIREATEGRGVDVAIDISGSVQAVKLAFKVIRQGGRISLIGIPSKPLEISLAEDIIHKEARVFGSSGRIIWQTWWEVKRLLDSGKYDPMPVITHRFPLSDFEQAFRLAESGEAGKIILYP
jgi:threonine 3-dehydrogenase